MRVLCLLFAMVSGAAAFAAEAREVYYQGSLAPLNIVPTFDKGYLIVYDWDYKIDVYAPDGAPLYNAYAHVPNAKIVNIQNAAADGDGTIAAAVEYSRDGTTRTVGGGIAVFDRSGRQTRFFDTGRYLPTQVCFVPDHSIWTMAWQGPQAIGKNDDYFVLRRYSQDGQELGAFLPRSSFDAEPDPVGPMIGAWQLRSSNARVGALFYSSTTLGKWQKPRLAMEWIETDLKGKEAGRWEISGDRGLFAFTQSGAIYAQGGDGIAVFDRTTRNWRPVAGMPDGHLLGADGDSLVFNLKGQSVLRWVPVSQ